MQNVSNAEIQQRVINLVELYRTKVGKESKIAQEAKADCDYWDRENARQADIAFGEGASFYSEMYGTGPHTEIWTKHLMVNEQLLGYFYAKVAGDKADFGILEQLLPDVYDKTVFTDEEEIFLQEHFKEMVNYIVLTPCDESLKWVHLHDSRVSLTIPSEVLKLIGDRTDITPGSTIYYPFSGFGQLANIYKDCKFYCEDKNAWMLVAFFANGIDARMTGTRSWEPMFYPLSGSYEVAEDAFEHKMPTSFDAVISYLSGENADDVRHLCNTFENLNNGGQFIILCPKELFEAPKYLAFRKMLVENKAIKEIIQLPAVMSNSVSSSEYCLLVAEKEPQKDVSLIDARIASNEIDTKHYSLSFDNDKFNALLNSDGKDPLTGLRKVVQVSPSELSQDILIPQIYVIERPLTEEHPVSLSTLCSIESTLIRDVQFDLPEDTPWILESDLTPLYTGDLNISAINKAGCPNNPTFKEDSDEYAFNKEGKFIDSIWSQIGKSKGMEVLEYRRCTFVDGNNDVVLYKRTPEEGIFVTLVHSTGKPYAVSKGVLVFYTKNGVDIKFLAALLRLPIVYRQLLAYQSYGITNHLDEILVPTDKRIVRDEIRKMEREKYVTDAMRENFEIGQKKHLAKLENYQHTMRKHVREIGSAVRRMNRYINEMNFSIEEKEYLNQRLNHISEQKGFLSEDIERLNDENTYGEAKPYDIDHCLKGYTEYFGEDVCPIYYSNEIAKESVKEFLDINKENLRHFDEDTQKQKLNRVHIEKSVAYVDIAEYNFGKIVRNILENAKKHGFDDFGGSETNERKIEILLCWDENKKMYRIDFRNNGNPLPDGLSKESYGENRKYAGKTGGTGIGGYEVAETVKHYNGDYAISQEGNWVVVSIYLPKSISYEQERI